MKVKYISKDKNEEFSTIIGNKYTVCAIIIHKQSGSYKGTVN